MHTVISIMSIRTGEALEELHKLARKAERYGSGEIAFHVGNSWTDSYTTRDWDGERKVVKVEMTDLIVSGEAPRVGDYEFIAHVELLDGGNMVDTVPGTEGIDKRFRHTDGTCEHCHKERARKDVYVVRDRKDGSQKQIGRNCLRDYMGIDNPAGVAAKFRFLSEVRNYEEEMQSARAGSFWMLESLVALSATATRLFGWCSKGQAYNDDSLTPTVAYVGYVLNGGNHLGESEKAARAKMVAEHNDADKALARDVIEWVRASDDDSDYMHNLRVAMSNDTVTDGKRIGIIASAVAAYGRAMEREVRRTKEFEAKKVSEFQGAEKDRLRDIPVTLEMSRVVGENQWGVSILVKFVDDQGNIYSWFTGTGTELERGERAVIDGTVKAHKEYKGIKETQLTRVKIKEAA